MIDLDQYIEFLFNMTCFIGRHDCGTETVQCRATCPGQTKVITLYRCIVWTCNFNIHNFMYWKLLNLTLPMGTNMYKVIELLALQIFYWQL